MVIRVQLQRSIHPQRGLVERAPAKAQVGLDAKRTLALTSTPGMDSSTSAMDAAAVWATSSWPITTRALGACCEADWQNCL